MAGATALRLPLHSALGVDRLRGVFVSGVFFLLCFTGCGAAQKDSSPSGISNQSCIPYERNKADYQRLGLKQDIEWYKVCVAYDPLHKNEILGLGLYENGHLIYEDAIVHSIVIEVGKTCIDFVSNHPAKFRDWLDEFIAGNTALSKTDYRVYDKTNS